MKEKANTPMANYFGLKVEVVVQMDQSSLIRFEGREFIVDTADLVFSRSLSRAA